ncbi:MAG TPA: hypothetical protein PKD17_04985, partial [Cellvibrionaceae bacterium]|nr:hypothetical protein [Cellvibrionaceae bacterium]
EELEEELVEELEEELLELDEVVAPPQPETAANASSILPKTAVFFKRDFSMTGMVIHPIMNYGCY